MPVNTAVLSAGFSHTHSTQTVVEEMDMSDLVIMAAAPLCSLLLQICIQQGLVC